MVVNDGGLMSTEGLDKLLTWILEEVNIL